MALCLFMVCRLKHRFLITAIPLESIDKVIYNYRQLMACTKTLLSLYEGIYS